MVGTLRSNLRQSSINTGWRLTLEGNGNEAIQSVGSEFMDIRELITGTFEDYWGRFDRALEGLTSEELT